MSDEHSPETPPEPDNRGWLNWPKSWPQPEPDDDERDTPADPVEETTP